MRVVLLSNMLRQKRRQQSSSSTSSTSSTSTSTTTTSRLVVKVPNSGSAAARKLYLNSGVTAATRTPKQIKFGSSNKNKSFAQAVRRLPTSVESTTTSATTTTATATATTTTTTTNHSWERYRQKQLETNKGLVSVIMGWIEHYDPATYQRFNRDDMERWVWQLMNTIFQLMAWQRKEPVDASDPEALIKAEKCYYELLVASIIYADRFVRERGLVGMKLFHVLGISALCTVKYWEERNEMSNKSFAEAVALTLQEVNDMEREFLKALGYSLCLTSQDVASFLYYNLHLKPRKKGKATVTPSSNARYVF